MAELVVLAVGMAAIVGAVGWHLTELVWARRVMIRRRVLVNLTSGQAVNGVLWARRGRLLVLKDAQLLEPGAEPTAMDGDVVIGRERVEFVQAVGGG